MNRLGSNSEQAENKLIILYLINAIDIPFGSLQIIKFILENKLINYFLLRQSLNELCDGGFLLQHCSEGKTFYEITDSGRQALEYFSSRIPAGIRGRIDNALPEARERIKQETMIVADFTPESEDKYIVNCRVDEGSFRLLDMTLAVGSRNDAKLICENWKKNSQYIYAELIESLTKTRE